MGTQKDVKPHKGEYMMRSYINVLLNMCTVNDASVYPSAQKPYNV